MPYFERKELHFHDSEKINLDHIYELAQKILEADRIDPRKFEHYDQKMIDKDLQYVRDRKAQFERQSTPESKKDKKMATVLEAIIHEQVELSDWLGPHAETITSSSYDDIANGIDSIVRWQREGEGDTHLGLGIDVTFSTDIRNKLNAIMENIENGKLTEIKYFASPDPDHSDEYVYTGSLKVPRVVVGIEKKVVEELADLRMKNNKKALASHPVQYVIAKEILDQLAVGEQYARHHHHLNLALMYRQISSVVERNLKEKEEGEDAVKKIESLKNDKVFDIIMKYLDDIMIIIK